MMADMHFEETCPCRASIKVSGFESRVTAQVQTWHRTHDKHANAWMKAMVEDLKNPAYLMSSVMPKSTEEAGNWAFKDRVVAGNRIKVEMTDPILGMHMGETTLRTHSKDECAGPIGKNGKPICCIHNPSDHHMVTWKQLWRGDRGIMERICPGDKGHGIGHPDPDDLRIINGEDPGVHGCDGCCWNPDKPKGYVHSSPTE